jgi:hypothetical protein
MSRSARAVLLGLSLVAPLGAAPAGAASRGPDPAARGTAGGSLALINPGFEQGTTGWTFTADTGVATNYPHGGGAQIYLNSGADKRVSQTVTASSAGVYSISAWIATGGPNGTYTVSRNGVPVETVALPSRDIYTRYTVSNIRVAGRDRLDIVFGGGSSWVNADDVMISPGARATPRVSSSNPKIVAMFDWAKAKAGGWVQQGGVVGPVNIDEYRRAGTGSATYGPSYWAGYAHRSGYYSRDFVHQLSGAHLLGFDTENKAMLRSFAGSATAAHKYFPVWALNFDNATYLSIDYRGPNDFVREVPAAFELVEKANTAFRWTGDRDYLQDPTFWSYYRNTTGQFVDLHNGILDNGAVRVAEGTGNGIFAGAASYNEQSDERLAEAGDAIGAQYQAYRAMAALARDKCRPSGGRGGCDPNLAKTFDRRADALKRYFNTTWSRVPGSAEVVRAYGTDGSPITGWGKENSWFMPMKGIIDAGPRNDAYLDFIDAQASGAGRPGNIEAITYLPDTFFRHHRDDTAWKWMQDVYDKREVRHPSGQQGLNGDYPEVSFTLVSQTIEGLMGIAPDASNHALATVSRLPTDIGWLEAADVPIGSDRVTVRHDGRTGSTLTNRSARTGYDWEARFVGPHRLLRVNGKLTLAKTKVIDGVTYTYAKVRVKPGKAATVRVLPLPTKP